MTQIGYCDYFKLIYLLPEHRENLSPFDKYMMRVVKLSDCEEKLDMSSTSTDLFEAADPVVVARQVVGGLASPDKHRAGGEQGEAAGGDPALRVRPVHRDHDLRKREGGHYSNSLGTKALRVHPSLLSLR